MQKYTIEQLKDCSKEEMICIVLQMQQENAVFAERLSIWQADKFGRKTEKLNPECEGQVGFFNEAEALANEKVPEPKLETEKPPQTPAPKRAVGDKERSLKNSRSGRFHTSWTKHILQRFLARMAGSGSLTGSIQQLPIPPLCWRSRSTILLSMRASGTIPSSGLTILLSCGPTALPRPLS